MEENSRKSVVNHFAAGANCQVFNGNITGCVFAMPVKPGFSGSSGSSGYSGVSGVSGGPCVSAALQTVEAEELMGRLVDAEVLKENWQPNGLSGSERGLVARAVCERLDISDTWQVFGQLWGEKPETLRSYLNKALELKKSLSYQEKLRNILD